MLTARIDEINQLIKLELGADECIHIPFSPRMVVAHVRALLRCCGGCQTSSFPFTTVFTGDFPS